ncbi:MAG: cytochrome c biogenesis protein CcsA [Chloroflexi bacterium]|uniref:cytochrome c biogenesis protein n=1 Tax=Candidatus Flexifilum breve TaxID=3140694 RepID=UPI0031361AD8|nr:cytochrome c biogenesis protein CcsA [Chloroflexota bacterium]
MANRTRLLWSLTIVTVIAVVVGAYFALAYAGADIEQGNVQRIFYFHVSAFAGAFIALGVTVFAGIAYLRTRSLKWDVLALAGVEVGLALGVVNLVTGSIWARPIWNTWWTWDPRLTSAAIMVLTYAAYLMLRSGIENADTRRRFASVYGILAFSTVVITLIIIRIRPDTIHPAVIGASPQNAQGGFGLTPSMLTAMSVNMVIWSVFVPLTLMWWRIRIENFAARVQELRLRALED